MNESALIPAELEAIQAAIRDAAGPRAATRPLPLLREQLAAEAKPALLELATAWAATAASTLHPLLPGAWRVDVAGIEVVEGGLAPSELRGGWSAVARVAERPAFLLVVHGPIIEQVAALRCGDASGRAIAHRPASAAALALFDRTGHAVLRSWIATWQAERSCALRPSPTASDLAELMEADALLCVSLTWHGEVRGSCQVYLTAEALLPAAPERAADPLAMARLAHLPVEVRVDLGALSLSLDEVRQLQPGATVALPSLLDAQVPIFIGGVLKAWGSPVVRGGVLAVQIAEVVLPSAPEGAL